jgi:hypothetical protein
MKMKDFLDFLGGAVIGAIFALMFFYGEGL